jgi:ring-1,2-phenylacetyl-CoA epoxidase subunit PaaC
VTGTLVRIETLPPAARYCLRLGDDALVMAQRMGEWLARAPQIEEDMALGNIGLDLIGQARGFLTRAGELSADADGPAYSEDDFAYWRDDRDFTNLQLVEQERGDFAVTIVRLLVLSTWQSHLYAALTDSADPGIAAIAAKAVKEVQYHQDHARQWTVRLGLGTAVSHDRMLAALAVVAPYVAELFDDDELVETLAAQGIAALPSSLRDGVETSIVAVLTEAGLAWPETSWRARGGRQGIHSTALGLRLAEMQHLARSHPGATW